MMDFGRNSPGRARRLRARVASVAVMTVVLAGFIAPAGASAAVPGGPAVVDTTVEFLSGADLTTPIVELAAVEETDLGRPTITNSRFALRIGYSCAGAAACTGVTVSVAPQQLDAFYGAYRFARYDSGTLPIGASLVSNSESAGQTISLGNLPAGATGSFTLLYSYEDHPRNLPASDSFFLDGTIITNTVTIDAANAGAIDTASDSLTWRIRTPAPAVTIDQGAVVRSNTDYTYVLRMETDCTYSNVSGWGVWGEPATLCAQGFTNSFTLPSGAIFVSATGGGSYDAATNRVVWSASGAAAATGWTSTNGWYDFARRVVVRFPDSAFAAGCVQDFTVGFETDVTYLDGQSKSAQTSMTHRATNCAPFSSIEPLVKYSSTNGAPNLVWDQNTPGVFTLRVGNRANVPGVATIRDTGLGAVQQHLRIVRVDIGVGSTLTYAFTDGTTGTSTATQFSVPAGKTLDSIEVVSGPISGPNLDPASVPNVTRYAVALHYVTSGEAPPEGWPVSNTASATMAYPDTSLPDVSAGSSTASIVVAPRPANFFARQDSSFASGGNPVAGQAVDYSLWGTTSLMKPGKSIEPQYVFVAPPQWDVVANSWALDPGAPAGAIFTPKTVTVGGETRQALFVHWPAGTVWGMNATWPRLRVQATPGTASPGSVGAATGFIGDASHSFPGLTSYWGSGDNNGQRFTDTTDIDGDGETSEFFARVETAGYTVGAASGLSSVKEICRVNPTAPGGCDWIADSSSAVAVSPIASDITYRVTLRNNGNTALSNVVAYDVLPHVGDTGTSAGSAGTPRGSQFAESVESVSFVSTNLSLAFSSSVNPCRAQVYPGGPVGCVDDWSGTATNRQAIRASVNGTLAPGASASFVYTANVLGSPTAGLRACNSIATAASGTPVSEPSPVCAQIVAADLEVTAPATIAPQLGRPTVLPFVVRNVDGTDTVPSAVIAVPRGVEVTSLTAGSWSCTGAVAPVAGPASLTCSLPTPLAEGDSAPLNLPARVTQDAVVIRGVVSGPLFDSATGNNTADIRVEATSAPGAGFTVTKDDGRTALVAGQESTYTISVRNQLTTEAVGPVALTDTLPPGLTFVSASDGGTLGPDGRVQWSLGSLSPAGEHSVSLTVRVADDFSGTTMINSVEAIAADPAFPGEQLSGGATDVDQIDRVSLTKSVVFRAPADPTEPQPGDVLEYRFAIANTGGGNLTDVELIDTKPGMSAITFPDGWPGAPGELDAGESVTGIATYSLTVDDVDQGGTSNTATVTAASASGEDVSASSSVDQPLPALTGLTLAKTAELDTSTTVRAGATVTYTLVATNSGNSTLRGVTIVDPLAGLSSLDYSWPNVLQPGVLHAGQSVTATATYVLTQADIDGGLVRNNATASAIDVGDGSVAASSEALVTIPAVADVVFRKTGVLRGDADRPAAGDSVEFTFEIENAGNVTVSALSISEHLDGTSDVVFGSWPDPGEPGVLAPGESVEATASYSLLQRDIDAGEIANTATLDAAPSRGGVLERPATAVIPLAAVPALTIAKTAELQDEDGDGLGDVGEAIVYGFEVSNTGNVTIADCEVVDPMVTGIPAVGVLVPGQSARVFAAPYIITASDAAAGDLLNIAVVTGNSPGDRALQSEPASVVVEVEPDGNLATTGGGGVPWLLLAGGGFVVALGGVLLVSASIRRKPLRKAAE